MKAKTKALAIARAASEKKAFDIVTIDMRKMSNVCDYFVITSGASTTQVKAIADNILAKLSGKGRAAKPEIRSAGEKVRRVEGQRQALWIVLDYVDVVAHVFFDETRRFYDLERLWQDAPKTRFKEAVRKKAVRRIKRVSKKSKATAKKRKKV